ncbi:MAG: tRNA (adenosine(37)-N6)-dimethylallyltransferase MiaA [candidate division KSB1 bacterium]|nr:tRNA (adenosine(37)-N6)-dimethylallyltransferase MiaA [candidate division KSB1 bacterium]
MTAASNVHRVLVLVGPTAVGKTALSLIVAEQVGAEIVSADSRQVYCHMDIGTAKPTPEERRRVPHHFIDVRSPVDYYSAGEYGREARACIEKLLADGRPVMIVGGSGFYLRALIDGLFAPPLSDPQIKELWRRRIAEEGKEAVFDFLRRVDPMTAARLHCNDAQRVVRALEVYSLTGRPLSAWQKGEEEPANFPTCWIGLTRSREQLYKRIEQRVDEMIAAGLVEEAESLLQMGFSPDLNSLRTVGYQEAFAFLAGKMSREEMIRQIKLETRRYAKRQLTWFRRDDRIHWIDLDQIETEEAAQEILQIWRNEP